MSDVKPLGITELVLRDGHQSLLATRMRIDDMLPIAEELDRVGYWSMESWGGATYDACIRFLGEDPWERLRKLKEAMPNTPQQMLLRGQNLLGYRHYADDVVKKFVERAAANGVDVFRIFDAMNDPRNLETAIAAVLEQGKHAQGTLSYTVSPVHNLELWLQLAKDIESMGANSIAIKDMAGLLRPYEAYTLVQRLKQTVAIPIHMQCHATTGLSTATMLKAIEAGIDNVDASISSMSQTYGHTATETVVAFMQETERDTGFDLLLLEEIATHFRQVRKKYARFEGSLKGIDARILVAQVPGGMLTNLENQLREQGAEDRMDEVLEEIPVVRKELGYIPLVTPTSQIVGTQAVLNVLGGERYKNISKETAAVLRGEYGATPAPVDAALQKRVSAEAEVIQCRPADKLQPEMETLTTELQESAQQKNFSLAKAAIDDVLTYAMFPQVGLRFLENRHNPYAFEPPPGLEPAKKIAAAPGSVENYTVEVDGHQYQVKVVEGELGAINPVTPAATSAAPTAAQSGRPVPAPLAGNVIDILVTPGQGVDIGDKLLVLEAMKMETTVSSPFTGQVTAILVNKGDAVENDQVLLHITD
ncbi:MAG: sodium-extruding oxaloacetate decarboxylase subunit alpha [Gammaproteobacteria bacterium]